MKERQLAVNSRNLPNEDQFLKKVFFDSFEDPVTDLAFGRGPKGRSLEWAMNPGVDLSPSKEPTLENGSSGDSTGPQITTSHPGLVK